MKKNFIRKVSVVLACILLFTCIPVNAAFSTRLIDVDGDGAYTEDDLWDIFYHLSGAWELDLIQQQLVDLAGNDNGTVDWEDFYWIVYVYYLNMDTNPGLTRTTFYSSTLPYLVGTLGDLNSADGYNEWDLQTLKDTMDGTLVSDLQDKEYMYRMLADVNKDLVLDEEDLEIYEAQYMSDIPFTYTLDETAKTMTLTGAKDSTATYMKIKENYTINGVQYQVTSIAANAFSNCTALEEVYLPDSVTTIAGTKKAESPFYGISNGVLKIYCEAASRPTGYRTDWSASAYVAWGYTMKNIDDYFYYTADATTKTLTITEVKGDWYEANATLTIDDRYLVNGEEYKVTAIGDYALYYVGMGGSVEIIELPAGITVIGEWACADNEYLEYVDLYRCIHLKEIKESAFAECSDLYELYIPASVETIHADTLEESILYESNPDISVIVNGSGPKAGWGTYWNYIDATTVANTTYLGAAN